jgi:hypothetical protein
MACHWEDSDSVAQEMFSNVCACVSNLRRYSHRRLGLSYMYMHCICCTDTMINVSSIVSTLVKSDNS